jgi:sortase A
MMVRVLLEPPPRTNRRFRHVEWLRNGLLIIAVILLGYTGYVYIDAAIFEARQDRVLDESASLPGEATTGSRQGSEPAPRTGNSGEALDPSLIGRIAIPRLNVRAVVQEGVDAETLRRSVGHVPGTALPGEEGNVGLAGHRDSFFRGLRDVKKDDLIKVETFDREYKYVVDSTKIVGPKEVQVLAATRENVLTLVTCYPFNYIGNAPRRFIVRARQVSVNQRESPGS